MLKQALQIVENKTLDAQVKAYVELRNKTDELTAKVEKLEDQGVTVPNELRKQVKDSVAKENKVSTEVKHAAMDRGLIESLNEGKEIDLLKARMEKLGGAIKKSDPATKEQMEKTLKELKAKIKKLETVKESEEDQYNTEREFNEKPLHPSIKMGDAIKQLEQMLKDMKAHLNWEKKTETSEMKPEFRSQHEHELLYYEQQIDVLDGTIKQLKDLANKGKDSIHEGYKVGDKVVPNMGPHKGVKHEVIHVFDDGHMNIKPIGVSGSNIKYRLGAAKASPDQVKKVTETINECYINGKKVNVDSLVISGVESTDRPDYSDAYVSSGKFEDGTKMTKKDLEQFDSRYKKVVHDLAHDKVWED